MQRVLTFPKPLFARSLGSKVFSGPGLNHQVLGKLTKDGVVTIKGQNWNGTWLRV